MKKTKKTETKPQPKNKKSGSMTEIPSGQLFYAGPVEGEHIRFDTFESRHLYKVLRKRPGETIYLTDGKGGLYTARITTATANRVEVRVEAERRFEPPARKLHIFLAPPKNIDRFEWFLEKAVELGVWEITPLRTKRGERSKINFDRMEKIIISALKQSLRTYKPALNHWQSLSAAVKSEAPVFAALCQAEKYANNDYVKATHASIIIGPEGGFSPDELDLLRQANLSAVKLGNHRLRTETAGVAAVCLFNSNL